MPVHINEVVVRGVIEREERSPKSPGELNEEIRRQLIADCVEQVLGLLKMKDER